MIPRYASPEMTRIWSDENRFRLWLEVETTVCEVRADLGQIPAAAAGTWPSSARTSQTVVSTSSHRRKRFSSDQMRVISGLA